MSPQPRAGQPSNEGQDAALDLYWIPLGAGARVVRASGRIYETIVAAIQRRRRRPLFHSALVVRTPAGYTVIEVAPVPDRGGRSDRGVTGEGPVGSRLLRRFRVFRYEVRRWRGGSIPDLAYAVASPVRISDDPAVVEQVLALVELAPTPVWGRDELGHGEMWNSNSVTSWVLACAGVEERAGKPPMDGRAPGWDAGVREAQRWARCDHRPCVPSSVPAS